MLGEQHKEPQPGQIAISAEEVYKPALWKVMKRSLRACYTTIETTGSNRVLSRDNCLFSVIFWLQYMNQSMLLEGLGVSLNLRKPSVYLRGFFDRAVGKDEFQGHLLHPEYGLRVNVAQVNSNRQVIVLIYFNNSQFLLFVLCEDNTILKSSIFIYFYRYLVLENEFTHIGCFLNELILDQDAPSSF